MWHELRCALTCCLLPAITAVHCAVVHCYNDNSVLTLTITYKLSTFKQLMTKIFFTKKKRSLTKIFLKFPNQVIQSDSKCYHAFYSVYRASPFGFHSPTYFKSYFKCYRTESKVLIQMNNDEISFPQNETELCS